ncbi:MAG: branched-chain amino acid transport system substrate-binding protein, partial [Actinomycetota bacterium]
MRKFTPVSAALAVLAVVAVGCGGNASSDKPPSAAQCNDPGVTASQITVGGIYPQSGQQGGFFKAVGSGVLARFHAENEAGGVDGRQLKFTTADDGDGELANLNAARHLVVDDHVFGVIEGSTNSDGSGRFLKEEGVPVTGWGITSAWGQYKNMFGYRYSTSPKPEGEAVTRSAQFVKDRGGKRIGVIAGGADASINVANQFADAVEALGMSVGYKTTDVPLGTTDWGVQVQGLIDGHVDTLYTGMAPTDSAAIVKAAKAAGMSLKVVLLPAGYDDRFAAAFGKDLEGAYVAVDWRPFELHVPAHDTFKENLKAVAPDEFPSQLALVGWLSADAFIRGLHEAGASCPTRDAFIDELRKVKDYTANGLVPPTDFGELFGKMPLCFFYVQLHDSHFV